MNINTELIINKKYEGVISNRLVKISQEYRVLAVLRYLFPGKYEQMKHGDKPDLQDTINRIGIEVTTAVQEDDMKASRTFAEIDKSSRENLQKSLDKIKKCGYEIYDTSGIMHIVKSGTIEAEKNCLCNAILKKCKKANNYEKDFKVIGLAVLFPDNPTRQTEEDIIKWIKELHPEIEQYYKFVYVISSQFCLMYDIKSENIDKKILDKTVNRLLWTIARMTAEGEITLESDEWKCTINHSNIINV
ncbi:MAG: hypothetical protein K6F27_02230 [Ruminococcus sp.]|nr:hypothetical protein [Ruminococcus sp.]